MNIFDPSLNEINSKEIKAMLTTTPSRIFHSHGHFWDEGFHNMVLVLWNEHMSVELLSNWLDLMNEDGWIPRELIIDQYSKLNVPKHYHNHITNIANPPTFLFPLLHIAKKLAFKDESSSNFLKVMFSKVARWFDWFINSQAGYHQFSYRWRGRDHLMNKMQKNKMTMSSGIDDYPRSKIVDRYERHLDLRCWIAFAANITGQIANLVGEERSKYDEIFKHLTEESLLDDLHWDNKYMRFGDFGAETGSIISIFSSHKVVNRIGYISIFPFLMKIIHPDSYKLKFIIDDMTNERKLWTDYGLRSLSKSDEYYKQNNDINAEDEPQWRGSIRLNINYLALRALKYYETHSVRYQNVIQDLYQRLRENILNNVIDVYYEQGNFYERYNDETGAGEGHYPHSSASLFILILSEEYFDE
ncbi:hypothetical protein FSP39_000227 [Pinctada imbricata]|uniref:mannosyl-oligosaccharide glucosidase n=1 Tax=Pinctada imbricata TaxID=66713 RepID=A0AA88XK82_PINIB|nr:hypothetical protein FSP39_000227 [Pinctada imbricata]